MKLALKTWKEKEVSAITYDDAVEIIEAYKGAYSTATANDYLRVVRTVVYYAQSRKYLPAFKFPLIPSPNYKRFVPPSVEELQQLYNAAAPHIQRVIILGAYFGVRIGRSELFALTWDDVDFSHRLLRVHGSKKNADAPWREVPIRESLLPVFLEWKEEDAENKTPHLVTFNGKPIASIKRGWIHALRRAGITRRIRPYDLRHAFGTELVAAGVDVGTVAHLMGHNNPMMLLRHYQFVMDKQKKAAVEALPSPPCMPRDGSHSGV